MSDGYPAKRGDSAARYLEQVADDGIGAGREDPVKAMGMHCKDLAIVSIQGLQVPGLVASLAMTMARGANNQHKSWREEV